MKDDVFMWLLTMAYIGGLVLILAYQNENIGNKVIAAIEDSGCATPLDLEVKQRTNQTTYVYESLVD